MNTSPGPVPHIAAVIPAWNAAALLPEVIGAIRASHLPVGEIILFDDGSTDDTAGVARALGARVIRNDGNPLGPGEGRNRATATTDAALVVFVDSDVVVHPDAIARLAGVFTNPNVVAAFGSYDDNPPAPRVPSQYANLRHHYVHQQGPVYASTFWAGLGMVRRAEFLAIGGYDRGFGMPNIEDIEFGARIIARGGRIKLVREAQATHLKNWSLRQLWRTDIFSRAIPWSRLIGSGRHAGGDLNGATRERVAAVLAYSIPLGLAGGLLSRWWLLFALLAALAYVVHNRGFFSFLSTRLKGMRLAGAIALHWTYHLYASAIFVTVSTWTRFTAKSAVPVPPRDKASGPERNSRVG